MFLNKLMIDDYNTVIEIMFFTKEKHIAVVCCSVCMIWKLKI